MKNQGLGRSIIRSKKGRPVDKNTSQLHNVTIDDGHEWSKMGSITEQNDLDDLMTVARLASKEFAAERRGASILQTETASSVVEKVGRIPQDREAQEWIRIPRKPSWDRNMSREQLHQLEQESFLEWRRQIAQIEESDHFILTPFERNLDMWRQLWRVVELSDVVVQIVDARNPELFYCADLAVYAKDVNSKKETMLLLNKADLLTQKQREAWAQSLNEKGITFAFFSALALEEENEGEADMVTQTSVQISTPDVLTRNQLISLLSSLWKGKTIGLVGYPNVGKSSTINSLMGEKKVGVALTPGKTKHYQTLFLPNGMKLCDCPGLVFPNFSTTKSELVLNGILPVDQLKDWISPIGLLADRIPRDIIDRFYGITLPAPGPEEDPSRKPTAAEVLCTYAIHRGFMTSNHGNPDQSRAARIILKDFVAGKLLYCHGPVGCVSSFYEDETFSWQRTVLPVRTVPLPHKPAGPLQDQHMEMGSVGFVTKKPGAAPSFSSSKKHFKGKR